MKKIIFSQGILGLMFFSILLLLFSCSNNGKKKIFNGTEVFYTSAVTENDADKLGSFLINAGFTDGEKKSVQLNKTGDTYQFRMVVKQGIDQDERYKNFGKVIATDISKKLFNGAIVETHFCDEDFKTLIVLPMQTNQ